MLDWFHSLRHQIGIRIAVTCFGLSLVTACIITGWQLWQQWNNAQAEAQMQLQQIEKAFLPGLIDALWTLDPARLKTQLDAIQQLPLVSRIQLLDDTGVATEIVVRQSDNILSSHQYPLSFRINSETFPLGELRIELDASMVHQQLWLLLQTTLLALFTALLLGNLMLIWLFRGWVTRQLTQVAEFAKRLTASTLAIPISLERAAAHTNDEIGSIVSAITQMQQQLREEFARRELAEQELLNYQSQLEQMVATRTDQLAQQTAELTRQSQQLIEQNAELNAFAHTVAHDLKHPLTSVIGMSALLRQPELGLSMQQQQQFLAEINESSLKMSNMISSLLQLASLRSDADVQKTATSLHDTLQGALAQLSHFIREQHAQVVLIGTLPTLQSNPQWLEEIWLNYLSNAIKYGGPQPRIEVGCEVPSPHFPHWKFWVRDYGAGIPTEQQPLLFSEFTRLQTSRRDSHGLGLSIVKRICHKLGGNCGYAQADGGGSFFWFSLLAEPSSTDSRD